MKNLLTKIWNNKQYIVLGLIGIVAMSFILYPFLGEQGAWFITKFLYWFMFVSLSLINITLIAESIINGIKESNMKITWIVMIIIDIIAIYFGLIK